MSMIKWVVIIKKSLWNTEIPFRNIFIRFKKEYQLALLERIIYNYKGI